MLEQSLPGLHVLVDMSQYKPESGEHIDVPHKHGKGLDIKFIVSSQVGPEKHMQLYGPSQGALDGTLVEVHDAVV